MDNKAILARTDTRLRESPTARRLGLTYALLTAGISLVMQLVSYITTRQMDTTGGLAGIGTRSILVFIQTITMFLGMAVLPFLELGHCAAALRTARGQRAENGDLLAGLRRIFPLVRLMLLRGLLAFLLLIAASNAAAMLYMFLPGSQQALTGLETAVGDMTAEMDTEFAMAALQQLWPMYAIAAAVFVALLIPITYRLRLADLAVLDGEDRALKAMLESYRTMRGSCLQLFFLDVHLWGYYLLTALAAVLAYGDRIFGVSGDLGLWVFYLLSLLVQTGAVALLIPRVHTAYATFYLLRTQEWAEHAPSAQG